MTRKKRKKTPEERHEVAITKLGHDAESYRQKRGRKTLFRAIMIKEAEKLAGLGHTMKEIASFWGIGYSTLKRWAQNKPEFRASIKDGRIRADVAVEMSLYKRAMGYSYTEYHFRETVIIEGPKAGQRIRYADKEVIKRMAPDITAGIFFLKNRRPDMWRDMRDLGIFDELGEPLPLRFVEVGPREPVVVKKEPMEKEKDASKHNH